MLLNNTMLQGGIYETETYVYRLVAVGDSGSYIHHGDTGMEGDYMIILDMGGGDVCKNNIKLAEDMVKTVAKVDRFRRCVLKWQLFTRIGGKTPLNRALFERMYWLGVDLGFKTTASVFDLESWKFLERFMPVWVKIPNTEVARSLVKEIEIPKVISLPSYLFETWAEDQIDEEMLMCVVSEYPTTYDKYTTTFTDEQLEMGISDHTTTTNLYTCYMPPVYEKHFVIPACNTDKPRPYAIGPDELKELLLI
jgi:sialic acid synthase SpsE